MNVELWKQIEQLFHAAIGLNKDERKTFLDQAVRGDDNLRASVEALLNQDDSTAGLRGGSLSELAKCLSTQTCPTTVLPGTRLGPYRIETLLGIGGMGEVYRGHDTRLNRAVAIKVIVGNRSADKITRERFYREARAASALSHRHICAVYDIGESDGKPYLVLEYLEGQTLGSLLSHGSVSIDDTITLAIQIADALHTAHSKGVLHRDIKAANVFVTHQCEAKILDFGIAKLIPLGDAEGVVESTLLTDTGAAMGTVAYMSPEQARGELLDARSDLFSFGVLLYQMVTGQLPFIGSTTATIFDAILNRRPVPIRTLRSDVPRGLELVINSALEKKRHARVQSAADLKTALSLLKDNQQSLSVFPRSSYLMTPYKGQPWKRWTIPLFLLIASLIAGTLFYSRRDRLSATVDSVAILPFEDLSRKASQTYLADGITDGLIVELSKINALTVMKTPREPLTHLAGKLNVDRLINGSVTNSGNQIQLAVQLIELRENRTLWTRHYDCNRGDLPNLQSTISQDLLRAMNVHVTNREKAQLSVYQRPVNGEAYEAYLRGRQLSNRQTAKDLKDALEEFRNSIAVAPNYAPSYAGMADCYSMLAWFGVIKPLDVLDAARAAARKATQIDPNLAEAHISLGLVTGFGDWDWRASEREFKIALALNPGLADCHHWYAHMLEAVGLPQEGLAELTRAHDLDALYPLIDEDIANAYLNSRDDDHAYAQVTKLVALQPNFWRVHHLFGRYYKQKRMFPEAITETERALTLSGRNAITSAAIGQLYAISGRDRDSRGILKELIDRSRTSYVDPESIAEIYAGLRQNDLAFEYLEKARSNHSLRLAWIAGREPALDVLRPDARFEQLLRRMGLASSSTWKPSPI
jgi:serine/threonine protein kinase